MRELGHHMVRRPSRSRTMSRGSLQHRLVDLEHTVGLIPEKPKPIAIWFVKPNGTYGGERCHSDRAEADNLVWHRRTAETQDEFERRVMADLRKSGVPFSFVLFTPSSSPERVFKGEKL